MKNKKELIVVLVIFLLCFGFNLFFSLQVPYYSSDEAYFNLQHSEYIKENFNPIVYDTQSYGGNFILNTHVWHYLLGIMSFSLGTLFAYKILPALLAALVVVFGYMIAKQITKSEMAAFFGAFIFAFIPNFINLTINQISLQVLFVPLMLLFIYSLLNIQKRMGLFLIVSLLIIVLEPMNFLFFLALILFLILMVVNDLPVLKATKESILFYVLLLILFNLILFKNLYFDQGLLAVWQNIPNQLYSDYFQTIDILGVIANIGIIPIILGITGLVFGFFTKNKRNIYLFTSIIASCLILLLLELIPFELGMMLLAVMLSITSIISIDRFIAYIKITKFSRFRFWIVGLIMVITIVSLIIPSVVYARDKVTNGVSYTEIEALEWLRDNTPEDSVVVASVYEGNLISTIANKINVIDTQFILAEDRYLDISNLYKTESLVKAQRTLEDYGVDYLYFSDKAKELYDVEVLRYADEEICFKNIFENEEVVIYEVVC